MPHIFPQSFPLVSEDTPRDNRQQAFWEALNNRLNEINTDKLPVVMMAHMAISGSNTTGHDLIRGGMDFVDISSIPVDFDYLALGHIHCPQNVDNTRARYCGTPIAVTFDEDYEHSVSIVDVNANCEPSIRTIPIVNHIPLKTIPLVAAEANEVIKLIEAYDSNEKAYLRANIKYSDDVPHNIREQFFDICKNKQLRYCTIKWENDLETKNSGEISDLAVEELQQISPIEIAQRYYLKKNKLDMSDEMVNMLKFVIDDVNNSQS
jgi:exonuclease SbcD